MFGKVLIDKICVKISKSNPSDVMAEENHKLDGTRLKYGVEKSKIMKIYVMQLVIFQRHITKSLLQIRNKFNSFS